VNAQHLKNLFLTDHETKVVALEKPPEGDAFQLRGVANSFLVITDARRAMARPVSLSAN
jgi:hypothetical protein